MRKLLALFLAVLIVFPMLLATLSLIAIGNWVLDRKFYVDLLDNPRLYEAMLKEDIPGYFNRRLAREIGTGVPAPALGAGLREVMTPDYLRDQALRIVDDTFDAIERGDASIDLALDLRPIKDALAGEGGSRFALALARALPVCAAGQDPLSRSDGGAILIDCRPSGASAEDAAALIVPALPAFVDAIPDHVVLNQDTINLNARIRGVPFGPEGWNLAVVVVAFVAGAFWLSTAIVGGEDRRERLLWLGAMLLIPAALIFLIGVAISTDFSIGWVRLGLNEARLEGVEYSAAFRQALLDVSRTALDAVASGFLMAGGISGAIGVALLAWGWSTPPERRYVYPPVTTIRTTPQPPASSSGANPQI